MQRRSPDRTLVPQNVFQELSFKRWSRRRLWRAGRRLPERSGDDGEEDNYKYREAPYISGSRCEIYLHNFTPWSFHNLRPQ